MSGHAMSAWPPADVVGLLEGDPHGCALATAVRGQDGALVDFILACGVDLRTARDPEIRRRNMLTDETWPKFTR
jgi:hypothetical protein